MTLRKLAGDTMIYGTGFILGKVLNYLLITVYLTWKFNGETEQYGLYTEFYFYVALLLIVLTLRMETTFFRFGSRDSNHSKAFGQAALLLVLTSAAWLVILLTSRDWIAEALSYPDRVQHVTVLGLIIAFDVLVAIPFASLRLEQRPVRFAILKLSGIILNILAVLFFFELLPLLADTNGGFGSAWYDPADRLLYVFVANLIGSLFVFVAFIPRYFKIKWEIDWPYLRRMLVYALPLVVVGFAGVINQSGYIVFLKMILPGEILENMATGGVYAAATRVAVLMSLFITAFNYAAEPFFFNQSTESNARQTYADVAIAYTIAGAGIFVGVLLYLDVIQLMLGTDFRAGMHVVPILLMAFFLLGLYYNFSIWYKLNDSTRYGALISTGGAVITIGLNVALIPKIGETGSAWAALACYAFMACACYILGKKNYPIPYNLRRMASVMVLAVITYATSLVLTRYLGGTTFTNLALNTVLLAAFFGAIYALERQLILSVVKRGK